MPYRVLVSAPYFLPEIERFRDYFSDNDLEPVIARVEERLEEDQLRSSPEESTRAPICSRITAE